MIRSIIRKPSLRGCIVLLGAFAAAPLPAAASAPSFEAAGSAVSAAGHVMLEWQAEGPVVLEMTRGPDFSTASELYRGTNHSLFVSGLGNGEYRFRLRGERGEVSAPLVLTVAHQSLRQALVLAAIGALVFVAVVAVILRGARDE